jgi:DNA-binding transcriptional regulator YdaS (Cro superfamily)
MPHKTRPKLSLSRASRYRSGHPFLVELREWQLQTKISQKALAGALGIAPASLSEWLTHCEADRDWALPAERVPFLASLLDVPPALFRPDMYLKEWKFPSRRQKPADNPKESP